MTAKSGRCSYTIERNAVRLRDVAGTLAYEAELARIRNHFSSSDLDRRMLARILARAAELISEAGAALTQANQQRRL